MTDRIAIAPVPEARRALLDAMAQAYFREVLPEGPVYYPAALDRYWIERGRHPYLVTNDGVPIGFALVWNHEDGTHEMVEFTIQPAFRHRGIGRAAAVMIFEALGGDWVLGVAAHPPGAMDFWRACLGEAENIFDLTERPPRSASQAGSFSFRVAR